jgi:hypothetical protein
VRLCTGGGGATDLFIVVMRSEPLRWWWARVRCFEASFWAWDGAVAHVWSSMRGAPQRFVLFRQTTTVSTNTLIPARTCSGWPAVSSFFLL